MSSRNAILTSISVILAIIVIVIVVSLNPKPGVISPPTGMDLDQSISDSIITVSFPSSDFALAINEAQVLLRSYIPPCDQGFKYCIYYNGGKYVGTNFESAGIGVKERDDLDDEGSCVSTPPSGFDSATKPESIGAVAGAMKYAWSLFTNIGDAGAGHYASGDLYRLFASSTCYAIMTRVGETQYANYTPGSIKEFTSDDLKDVQSELKKIIDGISLPQDGTDLFHS